MLERTRRFYLAYPQLAAKIPPPLGTELGSALAGPNTEKSAPVVQIPRRGSNGNALHSVTPGSALLDMSTNSVTTDYGIGQTSGGHAPGISPLSPEAVLRFSWTHILELIRLDDPLKRAFYENECRKGNWSVRQLQCQIGSLLYERTGLSKNKPAVVAHAHRQEPQQTIEDLIRDPYVLEFTGLADRPEFHETELEKTLLNDLQAFVLELGTGFCFEARQFRVTVGNEH